MVAENYWLARLINYMHFSGEVQPDPNPRVLDNDVNDVRAAVADGLQVYAFEGATHWLNAQGMRFQRTDVARQPFANWLAQQPAGTVIVAAASGRALPLEWLPPASRSQNSRPGNFGVFTWTIGESEAAVDHNDSGVVANRLMGPDGRALSVTSNDEGPRVLWGDDVLTAIDRGLVVVAFSPSGQLIGHWAFAIDDTPGVQLPPTPFVNVGERVCETLRQGQIADVSEVLATGGWLATAEGKGPATITLATATPVSAWRHRLAHGRGEASIDAPNKRLVMQGTPGTRPVFSLSMPPNPYRTQATLERGDVGSVLVCRADIVRVEVWRMDGVQDRAA